MEKDFDLNSLMKCFMMHDLESVTGIGNEAF